MEDNGGNIITQGCVIVDMSILIMRVSSVFTSLDINSLSRPGPKFNEHQAEMLVQLFVTPYVVYQEISTGRPYMCLTCYCKREKLHYNRKKQTSFNSHDLVKCLLPRKDQHIHQ